MRSSLKWPREPLVSSLSTTFQVCRNEKPWISVSEGLGGSIACMMRKPGFLFAKFSML